MEVIYDSKTSLFSRRLDLIKNRIKEKQNDNQPKEESPKQTPKESPAVETRADEILALQNSVFLSLNKNKQTISKTDEPVSTESSAPKKNASPQKEIHLTPQTTENSLENNFFITKRTIKLDDLIPTPKTAETEQPPAANTSTRSSSSGGVVVNGGTKLADEFTSVMAQIDISTMPSDMANGIQEFASLIKNRSNITLF